MLAEAAEIGYNPCPDHTCAAWRWIPPAKGNSGENRSRVFNLAGASLSQLGLLLQGQ